MQAPRTSRTSLVKGRSQANVVAQQALMAHWQSIVKSLDNNLKTMKANYVRTIICLKKRVGWTFHINLFIFIYFFSYVDAIIGSCLPRAKSVYSDILVYQCPIIQQVDFFFFLGLRLYIMGNIWGLCGSIHTVIWTFSLLLRRECCSFSNGEYVKAGLAELEQWCCYATEEVRFHFVVSCSPPPRYVIVSLISSGM